MTKSNSFKSIDLLLVSVMNISNVCGRVCFYDYRTPDIHIVSINNNIDLLSTWTTYFDEFDGNIDHMEEEERDRI